MKTLPEYYLFIFVSVKKTIRNCPVKKRKKEKKLSCFLRNIVSIQAKYQETEFLSPQEAFKRLKTKIRVAPILKELLLK